jgi:hypothetical protein
MENTPTPPPIINRIELENQKELITQKQRVSQNMVRILFYFLIIMIPIFSVGASITYNQMIEFPNGIEVVCDCQTYNHTYDFLILVIIGGIACITCISLIITYQRQNTELMTIVTELINNIEIYEKLTTKIEQLKKSEPNANIN